MDALECKLGPERSAEMTITLQPIRAGSSDDLRELRRDVEEVAIYVIPHSDFDEVHSLEDVHGIEVPRRNNKGLPYHFFERKHGSRIPAIHRFYRDVGGIKRSVGRALDNAREQQIQGVFFVSVSDTLWQVLRDGAQAGVADNAGPNHRSLAGRLLDAIKRPAGGAERKTLEEIEARLLGETQEIESVHRLILRAANVARSKDPRNVRRPVLVVGESGTGKENIAKALHFCAWNGDGDGFHPMNCASSSEDLFDAELFGYVKGAFTGATETRDGIWQVASERGDRGTLFLDEVGELGPRQQAKLLRALQNDEVRKVGSTEVEYVSANVVAATNADLPALVKQGLFREDLYFRLTRGLVITAPPLRGSHSQIKELANRFWEELGARAKARAEERAEAEAVEARKDRERALKRGLRLLRADPESNGAASEDGAPDEPNELGEEALRMLRSQPWPGNVRQLKGTLERCHMLFGGRSPTAGEIQLVLEMDAQLNGGGLS